MYQGIVISSSVMKSYKIDCPHCGKHSLYVTPANGLSYCFVCKYVHKEVDSETSGGRTQRVEKQRSAYIDEIRVFYAQLTHYYHSALGIEQRKYLYQRGYTDETITTQKIGYAPYGTHPWYKTQIAREAGIATHTHESFLQGRITFPYFKTQQHITDIRARALDPNAAIKYLSPYHSVFYRGAVYPYHYQYHTAEQKRILITEGEIKADIATQHGYLTLGLPGIGSWRTGMIPLDTIQYIIIFDTESDPTTQAYVVRAIHAVAQQLPNAQNIYVAALPYSAGKKAEIDIFLLETPQLFHSIIENAIRYTDWKKLVRRYA